MHSDFPAVTIPDDPPARLRLQWPFRRIAAAGLAAAAFALAVGVPTGLVPTPLYTRMTPVLWWNYVVWAVTTALGGLVVATYIRRPEHRAPRNGAAAASGGGLLVAFAVGCPICNKLVVAALGASGAMTIWAPLQPAVAVVSIVGLGWALRRRLKNEYACSASGGLRSAMPRPADAPLLEPPCLGPQGESQGALRPWALTTESPRQPGAQLGDVPPGGVSPGH